MWKMKVFPEQSGFLIAQGSVRPQRSPCPDLISFLLGCLTGRNASETTNSNRLWASAPRHTLFELKLSASSRHHLEDKSFIFRIFTVGTCPGNGRRVIISERETKEFFGLKVSKSASYHEVRLTESRLLVSNKLALWAPVSLCHIAVTQSSPASAHVRTAIGQECWMGGVRHTGTGKVLVSLSGVNPKYGPTTSLHA